MEINSTIRFASERSKGAGFFSGCTERTLPSGCRSLASDKLGNGKGRRSAGGQTRIRLFERTPRKLLLTEAGVEFNKACGRILQELEEAEQAINLEQTTPKEKLRIDLPASYGQQIAIPQIFDFRDKHPAVTP